MTPCRATAEPPGTAGGALRDLLAACAAIDAEYRILFPGEPL